MSKSNQHRRLTVCVLFAAIAQVLWPAAADAQNLPSGVVSTVTSGGTPGPSIDTSGTTMTVTLDAPRTIINWDSFDVGTGYTFEVIGLSTSDILVNRVLGGTSSDINGVVRSNAGFWLLNPSGVFIGSTGRFDVGSLLISTAGIADADVLDGDLQFHLSGNQATPIYVLPGSQVSANSGGITLMANDVLVLGSLASPGTNALFGALDMEIVFDADLNATAYAVNAGTQSSYGVYAGAGASFAGSRNLLMAAAPPMSGYGSVVLDNPGGANDIVFHSGSVELVSRDGNVIAHGPFTTPGDLTVAAGRMFQGNGAPTVGGDYTITAQDFSGGVFNPVFTGTDNDFTINDTAGGLVIADISAPGNLTVNSAGALTVLGSAGASPRSTNGDISLSSGDSISLQGNLATSATNAVWLDAAGSITQSSGVITTGTLHAQAGTGLSLIGNNSWQAASLWGGTFVQAKSVGDWSLLDGYSGTSFLFLTGDSITVAGDADAGLDLVFDADVIVGGDFTLESRGREVIFHGTVDGSGGTLTVGSASGTTFHGDVGASQALGGLVVEGASTFNGSTISSSGAIELDAATIGGTSPTFSMAAGSTLAADSIVAAGKSLVLGSTGGDIALGDVRADSLDVAGNNLTVSGSLETLMLTGSMDGLALLGGDNRIGFVGAFESEGLFLRNVVDLYIYGVVDGGAGQVRIDAEDSNVQIGPAGQVRGSDIALSAESFFNHSGADALAATGHWVVYQRFPGTAADYDGLDSGNTAIWGETFASLLPDAISGNRYVFAFRPTLTFTTIDASKTYGTDLSGSTAGLFTVTGYHPGAAGAFLADTAATAFSGAPLVTSAGFAERASVAGGPYAIDIANGSLVSLNGYQFAFEGAGLLTIDPKALTGTATAGNKTYDGTTDATGTVALDGVVVGDDVSGSATFTFVDKNAGIGKTVTVSGATLSGTDAGNYTVTLPATVLADILQKAITGTAAANNKTYDGTTDATGTVALDGVVTGDDVSGSATFTFSDKNAGTGKTVNVSGAVLSGADAGNYTVTLPATALADILQKAITGTATASNKTYDGTTAATGTVALDGVVAGDDVSGSATFAFVDKNAGAGKTLNVSGATLSGADAGNYTVTLPATVLADILQKAITGTATASNKTYDGTTAATGTVALDGVVVGDDVAGSATFAFADKNAGTGKTVTVSGATLSGADAGNYTVTLPASTLADILQKAITGTVTANDKTYDGTTSATGSVALDGVVAGDDVNGSATFTFSDKNAGTGKTVNVSAATLSGADAGNYTVTLPATVLADILQKAITGTVAANDKTYDGTTSATGSVALDGVVAGDDVSGSATFTFADKNAGTGKTVNVSGPTLSGADAGNYAVTLPATVLADILQKAITGTVAANDKTYDGTTSATGSVALDGVVAGDDVSGSATFTFADKNAGTGKTVTVSGATLTGADAGNYTVTLPATVLADILQKAITGTATVSNKTYDGTTAATGTVALDGVVVGDDVAGAATFTFSDKNAGAGKTVTVSGATLTGADAGNYTVTLPATVLADILQKAITGTATASNKTYDGTTGASGTVALDGVVAGDDVSGSATFTFVDKNAGTGKTVTVSGATLSGADAGNYTVTLPATVLASILQKAITGTAIASNKTYDGTTAATGTVALDGVVVGDDVAGAATFTFSDKNAGAGKTVTVSGATLTGADAGNYSLTLPATVLADILQKAITGTATVSNKTYDGTTAATGSVTLDGVVAGDDVSGSATFAFADRNAGTDKTVTVSGGTLSGADAGNYTLVLPGSTVADILQRAITVTADAQSKEEGSEDPALTFEVTQGSLVAGDALSGNLTRDPGEAPGEYAIGQGTLDASANYLLTFVGSILTITEAGSGPTDPTDGVVVPDQIAGVVRFLLGLNAANDAGDAPLRIIDERKDCDPEAPGAACQASRRD